MYFDPLYLMFLAPGLLLSLWASWKVKSTFKHFSGVPSASGMTGAMAAAELMRRKGIHDVSIEEVDGFLSDHYDPSKKVLRLSSDVYRGSSLASLGVAAHEAGHAIQHATGYGPLKFRSWVVQPAQLGSNFGTFLCMIGVAVHSTTLAWLGVVMFSAFVVFTLVTLPVEFDASSRAVNALADEGIISRSELGGTKAVLDAAALTYVAGAISAIMQLVYFAYRAGLFGNRDSDD